MAYKKKQITIYFEKLYLILLYQQFEQIFEYSMLKSQMREIFPFLAFVQK